MRLRLRKCYRAVSPAEGDLQKHAERMGSIRDNCNSRGDNYTASPGLGRATPLTSGKRICCIPNTALASPALPSHLPFSELKNNLQAQGASENNLADLASVVLLGNSLSTLAYLIQIHFFWFSEKGKRESFLSLSSTLQFLLRAGHSPKDY